MDYSYLDGQDPDEQEKNNQQKINKIHDTIYNTLSKQGYKRLYNKGIKHDGYTYYWNSVTDIMFQVHEATGEISVPTESRKQHIKNIGDGYGGCVIGYKDKNY